MEALFLALGYDKARLNIHKSGREIDIEAQHRTEARRVFAECKAEKDPIGGGDINKFVGSLDVEKHKQADTPTEGYFISLSGFTETAIEQEKEAGGRRLILLDADRVVEELTRGRIIVSEKEATELAGQCVGLTASRLSLDGSSELLAHEIGWVWAVFFSRHKERTHFALVHADGDFISEELAKAIMASDQAVHGSLHRLEYLPPPASSVDEADVARAQEKYFSYLASECGEIELEGLPADQEVGTRRLRLENLFVPLHLVKSVVPSQEPLTGLPESTNDAQGQRKRARPRRPTVPKTAATQEEQERAPIGRVLDQFTRIAVLGLPGGGKSTLLKRLATAYAFPERRPLVDDKLPHRPWLPLFVRCRQLGAVVKSPMTVALRNIAAQAEMTSELSRSFDSLVSRNLRDGTALLLVDGLDEISDETDRMSFVRQLRTFLATYPKVALCVTSREAGFRLIGGTLSAQCRHFRLADFDNEDIEKLTLAWHKEVVGNTLQIRADAVGLARTICANSRLQGLASNPLLLTTLLLVKRWIGQLPTKRTVLYGKAIEVLLMTWNVEGHQPLDPEEIIPQLEYLAVAMMRMGAQTISSRKLAEVLSEARAEMPETLGYARISISEFIKRVELRSSLLMLSGHTIENGTLYPIYEFRHLTFQEYLVAGALVNGHYPGRKDRDDLVSLLKPHLQDGRWSEIVPLAAVLAGRRVEPLIRALLDLCIKERPMASWNTRRAAGEEQSPAGLLAACLADEIQVPPNLLKEAIKPVLHLVNETDFRFFRIGSARYGEVLYAEAIRELETSHTDIIRIEGNLLRMFPEQIGWNWDSPPTDDFLAAVNRSLDSHEPISKTKACLAAMELAFIASSNATLRSIPTWHPSFEVDRGALEPWFGRILPLLKAEPLYLRCAALWATVWLSQLFPWKPSEISEILPELVDLWRSPGSWDLSYLGSWAISEISLTDREEVGALIASAETLAFLQERGKEEPSHIYERAATIVAAYYFRGPWSDDELVKLAEREDAPNKLAKSWTRNLLKLLGREVEDPRLDSQE